MTISYNWLQNYIKTDVTPEQISIILTDIGLEVDKLERVEAVRGGLVGVVVGEVITCERHPDADRLQVTTVDVGGEELLQIVCGAPNVAAGQKVLVATVGATLYPAGESDGLKIKRGKIRGVESLGMICAADELGVGSDHDGIMVLGSEAIVGSLAAEVLDLEGDYLIEIGLTPNRSDAASHYGVARDLAAYFKANNIKHELLLPSVEEFTVDNHSRAVSVEVIDTQGAPRYAGVTISGVKVGQSPEWMQKYLITIGINPKNSVVDITNFVLHELGQPLHAFDADRIDGDKIVVRTCDSGTKFVTLDEVERTLDAEDLMICSAAKPLCLAGIFGGLESGVTDATTTIFLESAYFDPRRVRKSARRHGMNTDSSFRFERGVNPDMTIYALKRAALLIKEYAGGAISSDIVDIYPARIEPFRFDISLPFMARLLGKEIPTAKVKHIIEALEITIESENEGVLSVSVPPYRTDVQREADLIEDILRIYGYNNIETPRQVKSTISHARQPDMDKATNIVAEMLSANGFAEMMSNSLTKASYYNDLNAYKAEQCVRILNPLSVDLNVMRQTLIFNALEAVELNTNRKNTDLKLYEFGNCYRYDETKKETGALAPYSENSRLSITITGDVSQPSWCAKSTATDFFFIRGVVEKVLKRFGIDIYALKSHKLDSDLFEEAISIDINGKELLQMGVVSKKLRKLFDLKANVYFAEINFATLANATKKHSVRVEELSKYPEVSRDLALLVDDSVTFAALRELAFATERKLLKSVTLFDVYQGDKLPTGKKSYAMNFILEDKTQTLTDSTIDKIMNSLIVRFEREHGAKIRS